MTPAYGPDDLLVAGPLHLRDRKLVVRHYDADPQLTTHVLDDRASAVMRALMLRPGELVPSAELLDPYTHEPLSRGQFGPVMRVLRKVLPAGGGVAVGILHERTGVRLVIDTPEQRMRLGGLELDPRARWCWVDGARVRLTRQLTAALTEFMTAGGELVTDEALSCPGGSPMLAVSCQVSMLRRFLLAPSGGRIGLVRDAGGYRLVVDEPADRITCVTLALNPDAQWCWIDGSRVDLAATHVPVLARLIESGGAAVTSWELGRAGRRTPPRDEELQRILRSLRLLLQEHSQRRYDITSAPRRYQLVVVAADSTEGAS